MPESSAIAGKPAIRAALRALMSALSRKVLPVSGGGSMPNSDWRTGSKPVPASNSVNSRSLPVLPLASTTRLASMDSACIGLRRPLGGRAHLLLKLEQPLDTARRQVQQRVELVAT